MALLYAWIIFRTDIPGKKLFTLVPIFALTIPQFVQAFAWIVLLNPQVGLINVLLQAPGGRLHLQYLLGLGTRFRFCDGSLPSAF